MSFKDDLMQDLNDSFFNEDEFGEVGPQSYLQKRFGLTAEHIAEKVKAVVGRK